MRALVLGVATLALSAGAATAQAPAQEVYPSYGAPYGYGYAPYGYGYAAPAPLYGYAAPGYAAPAPLNTAPAYGYAAPGYAAAMPLRLRSTVTRLPHTATQVQPMAPRPAVNHL
jgi:hypothetical protein